MSFYKNILAYFTAAAALMFASCSNVNDNPVIVDEPEDDGMVEINLHVTTNTSLSRAGYATAPDGASDGVGGWQTVVSRGKHIDKLILEVYLQDEDEFGNTAITRLTQYGDEGTGQREFFPYNPKEILTIPLRLMRGKTYRLAFWAQSSKCDAYTTDNNVTDKSAPGETVGLRNVTVSYDGAFNNDDTRDAFCKVETFTVDGLGRDRTIILSRPFAQINVGTTGADLKYLATDKDIIPNLVIENTQMTFGKINDKGEKEGCVATRMDVVLDKIDDSEENLTIATFKMNPVIKDEYLYVDLDFDHLYHGYEENYPTYTEKDGFLSETFAYLCMAYVLVPNPVIKTEPANPDDPEDNETNVSYDENGNLVYEKRFPLSLGVVFANGTANNHGSLFIDEVNARRNWRTNILGGLGNPGTSIVQASIVEPDLNTDYDDYNYISH